MDALTDYDPNDATMRQPTCFNYSQQMGSPLSGLTVGIDPAFFDGDTDPRIKAAVLAAADAYKQMGCTVKEVSLPSLPYAVSAYYLLSSAEAASNLARYDGIKFGYRSKDAPSYDDLIKNSRAEGFGDEAKRRILLGNYTLSSGRYESYFKKAAHLREQIKREYAAVFESCDFMLTPAAPSTAYPIGENTDNPALAYGADRCTAAVSLAGLPAVSTPCGYDQNGLPIGMSLVGRPFDEATILGAAAAFESGFARREVSL